MTFMKDLLKSVTEWQKHSRYRAVVTKCCSNCAHVENRSRIDEPTHLFCIKMRSELDAPDWSSVVSPYNVCDEWSKNNG